MAPNPYAASNPLAALLAGALASQQSQPFSATAAPMTPEEIAAQEINRRASLLPSVPQPEPGGPLAADVLARARQGQYGSFEDPLVKDPMSGNLVPRSQVAAALDTPVPNAPRAPGAPDALAGLAAGRAPQGPTGPIMMTLRSGSGSRTTSIQAPQFDPRLLPQAKALGEQRAGNLAEANAQRLEQIDRAEPLIGAWAATAKQEAESATGAAKASAQRWEEAGRELQAGRERLRNSKIDPNRLVSNMANWQKSMSLLSIAVGGFVEGFSQGRVKNTGLAILNTAIDRDIAAQRDALRMQLEDLQMSERQQKVMWSQWQAQESQRREAALRVSQLELAKIGLDSRRLDVKEKTSNLILGIKDQLLNLENQSRAKKTVSSTSGGSSRQMLVSPQQMGLGGAGAGKPPPKDLIDMNGQAVGVLNQMAGIQQKLANYSLTASRVPWNTESKRILEADIKPLAVELARLGGEKGPLNKDDLDRATETIMGGWKTREELSTRLQIAADKIKARTVAKLASFSNYHDVSPLARQLQQAATPPQQSDAADPFRSQ